MDQDDEAELERTLRRCYARFAEGELLDPKDRDLLRRTFPGNDDVENVLFAARNDLTELRERLAIHSEWEPDVPSDDTVIRRYLTFDRFESLLKESGLWFSRIDGFSDRFEATLPKPNAKLRDAVNRWSENDRMELDHNEKVRERRDDKTYINCWRVGEDESAVFWDAYVGDELGLAVETTVGDFRRAIQMNISDGYVDQYRQYARSTGRERSEALEKVYEQLSKLQIGRVEYIDYEGTPIPGSQLSYSRYFHKRNAFEDECEFRAVFEDETALTPDHDGYDAAQLHSLLSDEEIHVAKSGQYVPVDTEKLINRIVLVPDSPTLLEELTELTLREQALEVPVTRSRLDEAPN